MAISTPELVNCSICLSPLINITTSDTATATSYPCQHLFHSGCIFTWLIDNLTCPLCRRSVVTLQTEQGITYLPFAPGWEEEMEEGARQGSIERLEAIINRRADVNAVNIVNTVFTGGHTALYLAVQRNHFHLAYFLIENGASESAALNLFGWKMLHGEGGAVNLVEARRLFGLAAAQGDASAQNNLAWMHQHGKGGVVDLVEARRLFDLAAAQGYASAQNSLAWT